ncbi:hypothetical protein [Curtobacterium poinsettiae]|uniref:hypothetical protein n=1 Tax=Curtobacterium poinsettiae TaxID=159612 RepID=UPI0023621443|nr:hypothetical protein [Curtobacterium flaccumfaciens]MDD1383964.1 hypothetical protein [Curtobacterium flaccumfaciens pv. poinsettiae]
MHIEPPPVTSPDDPSLRGEAIIGMITALRSRPLHEVTPGVVAAAAGVDLDVVARFLTATLNIAASPEHPLAPMLHARWRRFHAFVQHALERDVLLGREPGTMEPARGSEQLLATSEELQLQSMVRPEMDLLEAFDRAVTRLREGWSRAYVPPVWELDLVH